MIKIYIVLFSFLAMPAAQAYTLDLPNKAVYANKKCQLQLGKKKFSKPSVYLKTGAMVQPAVLKTASGAHAFELVDERGKTDQTEFGQLSVSGLVYPAIVRIKKVSDEAIDLDVTLEHWAGWSDFYERCGVMVLN